MVAADPFDWLGQTIDGRYRADAVAGKGGFGIVYRGHHLSLDVPIAIKCLKVPQSLADEEREAFEKRFTEEGRVLHRLSRASAAIVQALDVGAAVSPNGIWTPYLVLEWLEGMNLEDAMRERTKRGRGRWRVAEAVELLTPAARALSEAHAQRVAHRDIKPANLFLAQVGERQVLKVLDFGIAKVIHDSLGRTEALRVTGQAPPAFTPQYGAPEQFDRRKGATGPWTDVHALALVLVELVTGGDALEGDDLVQLMACALDREQRPTPRTHGVDVGDALEAVLQRALALRPEDRFEDAAEFWSAVLDACPDGDDAATEDTDSAAEAAASEAMSADMATGDFLAELEASQAGADASPEDGAVVGTAEWLASRADEGGDEALEPDASVEPSLDAGALAQSAPAVSALDATGDLTRGSESNAGAADGDTTTPATKPAASRRRTPGSRWPAALVALVGVAGVGIAARYGFDDRSTEISSQSAAVAAAAPQLSGGAQPSAAASGVGGAEPSATASAASAGASAAPVASVAATGAAPSASARAAAAQTASAGSEPLAPPGYCEADCRVRGECTPTLVGKVVVCRAASDSDCKSTYGCTVHGQCHARNGVCVALSVADCLNSQGCKQTGECSLRKGKCLQELITDCTKYPVCKQLGMCTARDNACWATSDSMCKASITCTQSGNCRSNGKHCVP